jgi:HEAT repeat protein
MKYFLFLTLLFLAFACGKTKDKNEQKPQTKKPNKKKLSNLGNINKKNLKKKFKKKIVPTEDYSLVDVSTVINDISNHKSEKGERAFKVVRAHGAKAIPYLIKALSYKEQMVRIQALRFLGELKGASKEAIPELKKLFKVEKNNAIISMVIDTLGKINIYSSEIEELIANHLSSKTSLLRWQASKVLGIFGPKAKKQIPQLIKLLNDNENWIRLTAAKSIWKIDNTNITGFKTIGKDVTDSNRNFRKKFVRSIGEIKNHPKVIVPLLASFLEDKAKPIRRISAKLLGKFGKDAKSAVPNLKKAAQQGDYSLKLYSNKSIKLITDDK